MKVGEGGEVDTSLMDLAGFLEEGGEMRGFCEHPSRGLVLCWYVIPFLPK